MSKTSASDGKPEALKKEMDELKRMRAEGDSAGMERLYGSLDSAERRYAELNQIAGDEEKDSAQEQELLYVQYGCRVLLGDIATGREFSVRIVGKGRKDLADGDISVDSDLAKILMGKSIGQAVKIKDGKEIKEYEIMEIYRA